jgi:hypothetical protein
VFDAEVGGEPVVEIVVLREGRCASLFAVPRLRGRTVGVMGGVAVLLLVEDVVEEVMMAVLAVGVWSSDSGVREERVERAEMMINDSSGRKKSRLSTILGDDVQGRRIAYRVR